MSSGVGGEATCRSLSSNHRGVKTIEPGLQRPPSALLRMLIPADGNLLSMSPNPPRTEVAPPSRAPHPSVSQSLSGNGLGDQCRAPLGLQLGLSPPDKSSGLTLFPQLLSLTDSPFPK